ncbi:MAG: DUF1570 domain-containing protein [Planctomycetaceae bacterium]|nr:DUF1570 domain-containing protein [Planctomycetaceae bacterium]
MSVRQAVIANFVFLTTILLCPADRATRADSFTYVDENRNSITIEARLIGNGQNFSALERHDGQIQIVPTGAIQAREITGAPEPIDVAGMQELLQKQFGAERVRFEVRDPFLVALVLTTPLDRAGERRAGSFVKKAADFMSRVDGVFMRHATKMRLRLRELRFPMVLVIYESDEDFNEYAQEATGGQGLSASSIAGFYSGLTNWLAVRLSSCDTFEVPLHEAIHQQMYNRVFQRLAPIPKWFDEGIATGFESDGGRIDVYPEKVNRRYARQFLAMRQQIDWGTILADDSAFTADILAGNAYTLAWCMHWMLCTQHADAYRNYVAELGNREPLTQLNQDERVRRFEQSFGVSVSTVQADFPRALQAAVKRGRVDLTPNQSAGRATEQQALGEASINAVQRSDLGGQLHVDGSLKNVSPLRALTFYVTVETESGMYADWLIPNLKPNQQANLTRQLAQKQAPGANGGAASRFRVWIRSTPADSDTAKKWESGDVPGPMFQP